MNDENERIDDSLLLPPVDAAWRRCLEIWRPFGRVEDLPRGVRKPSYTPRPERHLGRAFAQDFRDEWRFVAGKLRSVDAVEAACAHDVLLDMIACFDEAPEEICALDDPISQWVEEEIEAEGYRERGFKGTTLGELFRFESEEIW